MIGTDTPAAPRAGSALASVLHIRLVERIIQPTTIELLILRLEAAGGAMLGLRVRGVRPAGYGSGMPDPLQDASDAYGWTEEDMPIPRPSAAAITAMDEAFGWIALIPLDEAPAPGNRHRARGNALIRRLVGARAFVDPRSDRNLFPWRRLATTLHCSPETARQWHGRGIDMIFAALQRQEARRRRAQEAAARAQR